MSSPSPANATVPSTRPSSTSGGEAAGPAVQPSATTAMPTSSTICTTSTMITDTVFAVTTTEVPAGDPPSRLITPYWRSKPVEIASDTSDAAMTASAMEPGSSRSTGCPAAVPPLVSKALNTSSTPTGMTKVISRPSPRRRTSRNS